MTETCTTDASPVLPRVAAHRRLLNTVADLQRQRRTAVPGPLICVAMNAANEQDKATVANNLAGLQTTGYLDVQPLRDNPDRTGFQLTPWGREQLDLAAGKAKPTAEKPLDTPTTAPISNASVPAPPSIEVACLLCELAEVLSAQIAAAQKANNLAEVRRLMALGRRLIDAEQELSQ